MKHTLYLLILANAMLVSPALAQTKKTTCTAAQIAACTADEMQRVLLGQSMDCLSRSFHRSMDLLEAGRREESREQFKVDNARCKKQTDEAISEWKAAQRTKGAK